MSYVFITFNTEVLERYPNTALDLTLRMQLDNTVWVDLRVRCCWTGEDLQPAQLVERQQTLCFLLGHWTELVLWMVQKAREMAQGRGSECREEEEEEGGLAAVTFLRCIVKPYPQSLLWGCAGEAFRNIFLLKLSVNMQDEPLRKNTQKKTL